jgi:predicted AlkP superfamily phosphohydrolase/phosphomutase
MTSEPMRTIAIGLDGCSWNVLEPLLETGQLPNLSALRESGAHGVLESTIPFFTGPAWCSFATGSSPPAHGIYDFMMLRDDGRLSVASQGDLRRRTYYQHLGRQGKRSVLINLPLDQDGCAGAVIVNSWLTGDGRRILPVGRQKRYERLLKAYRTFPTDPSDLDELCELERARFDLARELFLTESWDHFFCLVSSTDWLGHTATGAFLRGDEDARRAFLRLYRQIDEYIGWFVAHADDAVTIVLSDHGQCAETAVLRINAILLDAGFVTLADEATQSETPFFVDRRPKARKTIHVPAALARYRTNPVIRQAALVAKRTLGRSLGVELTRGMHRVDRLASRAFSPTDASFAVYTRDCDGDDIERLRDALLAVSLRDGTRALDSVWTVEELYGRPSDPSGPTLLFSPAEGVRPSATIKDQIVDLPRDPARGCHQRDGILLLAGPDVRACELPSQSIMDLAPTLLWAMGESIPADADGRPLFEAFEQDFVDARPVTETESAPPESEVIHRHSEEVARRLKALGYI